MKRFLIITITALCTLSTWAQEEIEFTADRPGWATAVNVLHKGGVLWETGAEFGVADEKNITLPISMVRVGILSWAELRLQYDGGFLKNEENHWKYKVKPLIVGTKIKVFDGWKAIPQMSFMAHLSIPYTQTLADEMHVAPQFYLLCHNQATDWLSVDYNIGEEWNGYDHHPSTFLALCLGFGLTNSLNVFAESYNYISKVSGSTEFSPNVDFGLTYQLNKRVQLDLYSGFNCKSPKANTFIGMGVAWMIR